MYLLFIYKDNSSFLQWLPSLILPTLSSLYSHNKTLHPHCYFLILHHKSLNDLLWLWFLEYLEYQAYLSLRSRVPSVCFWFSCGLYECTPTGGSNSEPVELTWLKMLLSIVKLSSLEKVSGLSSIIRVLIVRDEIQVYFSWSSTS